MSLRFPRFALLALAVTATPVMAAPVSYRIDPNHTDVIAQWSHFGYSNPTAHFGQADGTIVYDAENVGASSVQVTLPLSGLSSHVPDFDAHLRSADFFDADKFATASFKSTKVEAAGEGKLKVTGDLTIKGATVSVVLDTTINKLGDHPMSKRATAGFDATAKLKRSDFGLGMYAPGVSDEVSIRITTEASVPKTD